MHTLLQRSNPTKFDAIAWTDQLDQAIRTNDLSEMWGLVHLHSDPDEANRQLVDRIPRIAYRQSNQTYFNEMFLMPVVISAGSDAIDNADCWKQAFHCVDEMLSTWLPPNTFKMVFHGLRSYDHLGTWQPAIIRKHLQRAIPSEEANKIRYNVEVIQLPPNAPRLGFATMVLTTKYGWPVLPDADTLRDNRLRKVVSYALHNTADSEVLPPIVLAPDRFQYALTDGLALWLDRLNAVCGILGWSVSLRASSTDVVIVTLKLDAEPPWCQFSIRKHQIGKEGLNEVLSMLHAMAPNLEHPNDLPPRPVQPVALSI